MSQSIGIAPQYEDQASLKKYLRSNLADYKQNRIRTIRFIYNQAGTGSEVELSEKGGETIAFTGADADLYIWAENNHADGLDLAYSIEYIDAAGAIYTVSGTLDDTDSTTAVAVTTDTDFYRLRTLTCVTTANTGYVAIGTSNKATLYGIVEEGNDHSIHSRYYTPASRTAWITDICVNQSIATNLDCYLAVNYTPYGKTSATTCNVAIPNNNSEHLKPMFQLASLADCSFEIKGNLSDNTIDITIIEVETQ